MPARSSAAAPALGYLYQAIQGLFLLLNSESPSKMYIEKFDDIEFEDSHNNRELIQLKHHTKTQTSLSNSSTDLWRTIRIWLDAIDSEDFDLENTMFTIMTTNPISEKTSCWYLGIDSNRDVAEAISILDDVSGKSLNADNEPTYKLFRELEYTTKYRLFENVKILSEIPDIISTEQIIKEKIKYAVKNENRKDFFDTVFGWWFGVVIHHLSDDSTGPIHYDELDGRISDIAQQYRVDDLPVNYRNLTPTSDEELTAKQMMFVRQLNLISLSEKRIKKAISDYYKAFYQRSKWVRTELVFLNELEEYEKTLIDEWERYFLRKTEELAINLDEPMLKKTGREIYNDVEDAEICIRKYCTEPYVMRGSFHMLSDQLKVGWHPNFVERLQQILVKKEDGIHGIREKPSN